MRPFCGARVYVGTDIARVKWVEIQGVDMDTVYLVQRHRDNYSGPVESQVAADASAAMRVAERMRDEHRGDNWDMRTRDDSGAHVTFHPRGESGWVTVREKPLVAD